MSDSLIIFLHGVGSRGTALAGLSSALADVLPRSAFAAPDGPEPFDRSDAGRQWFSVSGVTTANRPARVEAARDAFDAVLKSEIHRRGFDGRLERVALIGFSQGAIMTLDAVASGRWPVGAAVAFSGRLASPEPLSPAKTPILVVHGTADPVMPFAEMEAAATRLKAEGCLVEDLARPGVGHQIDHVGLYAAGRFIAEAFGNARPAA